MRERFASRSLADCQASPSDPRAVPANRHAVPERDRVGSGLPHKQHAGIPWRPEVPAWQSEGLAWQPEVPAWRLAGTAWESEGLAWQNMDPVSRSAKIVRR